MIDIISYIVWGFHVCINFYIVQTVKNFWTVQKLNKDSKILLYPVNSLKYFNPLYVPIVIFHVFTIYFVLGINELFAFFIIFLVLFLYSFYSFPEYKNITESNNLNIGYGCALCYYKNYLIKVLPHTFVERVESFKSYHKVELQQKLFILVPESCKVKKYIDSSKTEDIERCRELPEHEETTAGIKDRTYNITVYHIKNQVYPKGVRLAVEYAMPLKGLYALKDKQQLSTEEMHVERKSFVMTLSKFITEDVNDLYKYCELVEYDDNECNIADVLLEKS